MLLTAVHNILSSVRKSVDRIYFLIRQAGAHYLAYEHVGDCDIDPGTIQKLQSSILQ